MAERRPIISAKNFSEGAMLTTNTLTMLRDSEGKVQGQVAGNAEAYRQDHAEANPFAPLRQNNKVECFTTGKQYFEAVSKAMKSAEKCIFIAGWQVNWDVELTPGERLIDILHERIQTHENLRVYVLPWMSPKVGVNTHDLDTMLAIFQLNAGRKTMQAMCCPAGAQNDYIGVEGAYFSHHQKMVVVDNKYAFVGGIDLAYGRCDDESFSLDVRARKINERYNPGLPAMQPVSAEDAKLCLSAMDLLTTTLSAGQWNAGGDSEPSKLSEFYASATAKADELAIQAVERANKAIRLTTFAPLRASAKIVQADAAVKGAVIDTSAEVAKGAAHAVSAQCAAFRVPDLYGGVHSMRVDARPQSKLPDTLRDAEGSARRGYNSAVDSIAELADFLAPVKRLRVEPKPQSSLPATLAKAERGLRSGYNTMVDVSAATAGKVQAAANGAKELCVQLAPAADRAANTAHANAQALRDNANKYATATQAFEEASVNAFQKAIVSAIGEVRSAFNQSLLGWAMLGNEALDRALASKLITPEGIQAVIDQLKRLLKLSYLAQLAINWEHAAIHPMLLNKKVKAAAPGGEVLRDDQPRQPWQDIHVQIDGPAVADFAMNFIRRWNATHHSYLSDTTLGDAGKLVGAAFGALAGKGGKLVGGPTGGLVGKAIAPAARKAVMIPEDLIPPHRINTPTPPTDLAVRVLRSAPLKLQQQECESMNEGKAVAEQCEIQAQMVNLIRHATDFIYIENQFFQSGFGTPSIDVFNPDDGGQKISAPMKYLMSQRGNSLTARLTTIGNPPNARALPANPICAELGYRIAEAIRRDEPFHVYLVLPVHPEGRLNDIAIIAQIHWTMQSLVFADQSLINRVRRAIAARKTCKSPTNDLAWEAALRRVAQKLGTGNDVSAPYEDVTEAQWGKYLTLLNLRACEKLSGVVRTEQIYIHSKLLIADDRHAIIGSANINDRSQTGKRDSELAVLLMDDQNRETATLRDRPTTVHATVRKLRMDLWKKHFALKGPNGLVQPASEMAALIERPAADATISTIRNLSEANADQYRAAFPFAPWSESETQSASIWPVCPPGATHEAASKLERNMPFHKEFWSPSANETKTPKLTGHFVRLPTYWTAGENNHPTDMSVMAVADAGKSVPTPLGITKNAKA
ncbi:MAG: hypothetical protein QM776_05950 [Rhodocyclaceae bacterium]